LFKIPCFFNYICPDNNPKKQITSLESLLYNNYKVVTCDYLVDTYIEIYHILREEVEQSASDPNCSLNEICTNILKIDPRVVHYETRFGNGSDHLPDIPRDTRIILGGAIGEFCVVQRRRAYKRAGFENVIIDPKLTFYYENP